jgi:hypothetical protein
LGGHSAHIGLDVVIHYHWHPLYGQRVRRIQGEQRASGEFVHVELMPGVVTIVLAWKLDPVYCAGLRVGAPQVPLPALCALHELLVARESRQISSRSSSVKREIHDGILVPHIGRSELTLRQQYGGQVVARQLHLVLEDDRLRGMTATEGRDALKALARFLLEASGVAMQEGSDDNA